MGPTPGCPGPQNSFCGPRKLALTSGPLGSSALRSLCLGQVLDLSSSSGPGDHLHRLNTPADPQGVRL